MNNQSNDESKGSHFDVGQRRENATGKECQYRVIQSSGKRKHHPQIDQDAKSKKRHTDQKQSDLDLIKNTAEAKVSTREDEDAVLMQKFKRAQREKQRRNDLNEKFVNLTSILADSDSGSQHISSTKKNKALSYSSLVDKACAEICSLRAEVCNLRERNQKLSSGLHDLTKTIANLNSTFVQCNPGAQLPNAELNHPVQADIQNLIGKICNLEKSKPDEGTANLSALLLSASLNQNTDSHKKNSEGGNATSVITGKVCPSNLTEANNTIPELKPHQKSITVSSVTTENMRLNNDSGEHNHQHATDLQSVRSILESTLSVPKIDGPTIAYAKSPIEQQVVASNPCHLNSVQTQEQQSDPALIQSILSILGNNVNQACAHNPLIQNKLNFNNADQILMIMGILMELEQKRAGTTK